MRARAIASALFYGVTPWWLYEPEPHYASNENAGSGWTHWTHLGANLGVALRWLTFSETEADLDFERHVNGQS